MKKLFYHESTKGRKHERKEKFRAHAAHTPRKRWCCGSACAARSKFRVFVINHFGFPDKSGFTLRSNRIVRARGSYL